MISIIITTYKREKEILERAINSACSQSVRDKEIIVVNDYPEYSKMVEQVVNKYNNIKLISHTSQKGACASRNDGAKFAQGEYIAFLDDDDEWISNKLELQLKKAKENNADLVYCGGIRVNDISGLKDELSFIRPCNKNEKYYEILLYKNIIGGCSYPLIRKETFDNLGGFDERLQASQDLELWLRISKHNRIVYLDKKLVIYHCGNESISTNIDKKMQGYRTMYIKHKLNYKAHPNSAYNLFKTMIRDDIIFQRLDYIKEVYCYSKEYKVLLRSRLLIYTVLNYVYKNTIKRKELKESM